MSDPTPETTESAVRRTVGGLDLSSAIGAEALRGLLTTGGVGMVLYQLATGQLQDIANDVDRLTVRMDHLSEQVVEMREDFIRLQVQAQVQQGLTQPPARP